MKAEVRQIPIEESLKASTERSNLSPERLHTLYAIMRRNRQRLSEIEKQLATLRRDVSRIDRANYRARDSASALITGRDDEKVRQMVGGIEV